MHFNIANYYILYNFIYFIFIFQRPTAKELLKFPFIRKAKKNSYIIDLIEKYKRWKEHESGNLSDSETSDSYVDTTLQFKESLLVIIAAVKLRLFSNSKFQILKFQNRIKT